MSASKYRGVLHCLLTVAKHEGVLSVQKGLVAGAAHQRVTLLTSNCSAPDLLLQA
jgi:hypothetical protein